jgi:uncharacterized membrane protein YdjX (TVP38/TMEM64 family)
MRRLPGLVVLLALLTSPLLLALPLKDWYLHGVELRAAATGLGWAAPAAFFAVSAVGTAVGLPRLLFCSLGGWLFGFGWGFSLSHAGTLAGAYGMFLLARISPPERLLSRFPKLRTFTLPARRGGWWTVFLVRQLPIGGLYNDVLLGWTRVSHRDFWIGTFLGFLPQGIAASLVGAGAIRAESSQGGTLLATGAALLIFLSLAVKWGNARRERPAESAV